ncbi:hypothetical protein JTE90_029700 [Oedothorax gibbosus]|uniref:Uncharacterized protein n=1 Tax=Oedothorax gibbosus TaxID=931172 RepID=A0AAV6UMQ6_9ARAC|nr:hypothetical protein JTE90_029700 [Oedothorax gibbosus]
MVTFLNKCLRHRSPHESLQLKPSADPTSFDAASGLLQDRVSVGPLCLRPDQPAVQGRAGEEAPVPLQVIQDVELQDDPQFRQESDRGRRGHSDSGECGDFLFRRRSRTVRDVTERQRIPVEHSKGVFDERIGTGLCQDTEG